jgi:hypothetical protein
LTHREEDKRVRRGKAAAKGATVIFWRLAGGEEDALLALRVLLFDLVAIFFEEAKMRRTLSLKLKWTTMVDESTLNLTVILHGTTQTRCIVVPKANGNALITLHNISCPFFRSFTIVSSQSCPESTARFTQPIQREHKDLTSLFNYMLSSSVALGNMLNILTNTRRFVLHV